MKPTISAISLSMTNTTLHGLVGMMLMKSGYDWTDRIPNKTCWTMQKTTDNI